MKMRYNLIEFRGGKAWTAGTDTLTEVPPDGAVGFGSLAESCGIRRDENGYLTLAEGVLDGRYLSPVVEAPLFEQLVQTWNADIPEGTWVEAKARVCFACENAAGRWSGWGSWGAWSPYIERRNHNGPVPNPDDPACPGIHMDCDIMAVDSEPAEAFQLQVLLHREAADIPSPVLRRTCAALRNRKLPEIPTYTGDEAAVEALGKWNDTVILPSPAASQMIRDPEIGGSICNPTTMTVLLAYRGVQVLPEEMAMTTVDLVEGFGNWSYVTAGLGTYGFRAIGRFGDLNLLRREIREGRTVGVSVHYAKTPEDAEKRRLPYLENAPCNTPGHILTVRGFGPDTVYVCDSAAPDDAAAHRCYRLDQFLEAWSGRFCYLCDRTADESRPTAPAFEAAELDRDGDGLYFLRRNGTEFPVTKENITDKEWTPGRMVLMARLAGQAVSGDPKMAANDRFVYPEPAENGHFALPEGTVTVYCISNTGLRLRADITDGAEQI